MLRERQVAVGALSHAADAVAETLPNAQRRTIAGQPHNVDPQALAPVLIEFFTT